jgi:molybdate transport system substrate-binding protein
MLRRTIVAVLSVVVLACAGAPAKAQNAPLTVFAAASLKNALDAIDAKWQAQGGANALVSYAASSALAKQIENGAPADVFISADEDWMNYIAQKNLIDPKTRVDLLGNKLVLIAPKASTAQATTIGPDFPLASMLGGGKLAMADPAAVPAGKYGKAALTKLGVWQTVSGHVAAAENVRAALALVARGEAPFGIVYQTDAAAEPGVKIIGTFPPDSVPPIVYPMALTKAAHPGAEAYATFLRGATAKALFEAQGFTVLDQAK